MSTTTVRIEHLPIGQCYPSPNNPRKHFDEDKLDELAKSIANMGLLEPILVREKAQSNGDGVYEILAGERRWRASNRASVTTIEAKILLVDDDQALEITVVENLQRSDLTAIEEAEGVASLLASGREAQRIAVDIGKSVAWVHLRAKLASLSPAWRKAHTSTDHDVRHWGANMLQLIARFPTKQQDEMLEDWDVKECQTAKELSELIARTVLVSLKSAQWDLDDAKLVPKAGACRVCPKRTSCQQSLFEEVSKDDRCADSACWSGKTKAFLARRAAELKVAEPNLLLLDEGHYQGNKKEGTVGTSEVKIVKASTPKAVPALIVGGDGIGKKVYVVKGDHGQSYSDRAAATVGRPAGKTKSEKERLEDFMKRRSKAQVDVVIKQLGGKDGSRSIGHWGKVGPAAGSVKRPERFHLVALASVMGIGGTRPHEGAWKAVTSTVEKSDPMLDEQLWTQVRQSVVTTLIADRELRAEAAGAKYMAGVTGLAWPAIVLEVQNALPLPKTLAKTFAEDGTPLAGLTVAKGEKAKSAKSKKAKASTPAPKPAKAMKPKAKKIKSGKGAA